jgi:hypothetical protein
VTNQKRKASTSQPQKNEEQSNPYSPAFPSMLRPNRSQRL